MNIEELRNLSWRFREYAKQNNLKKDYIISTRAMLIAELYYCHPVTIHYPDFAKQHNLHASNVCRAVNGLEKEQFINRDVCTVSLTDDGLEMAKYVFGEDK